MRPTHISFSGGRLTSKNPGCLPRWVAFLSRGTIGDRTPVGSIESGRPAAASAGCLVPVRYSSYGKRCLARVRPVVFPTPNHSRSLSDAVVSFGPSPRSSARLNNETLTGGAQGQAGAAE